MPAKAGFNHLTLDDRIAIEEGIYAGRSKADIARAIGKDKSTVGKEIQAHRYVAKKTSLPKDCANYRQCPNRSGGIKNCPADCPMYSEFYCSRRDRTPGACNGCPTYKSCRHTKIEYKSGRAQREYKEVLVESRSGANLSTSEATRIAGIIAPLLRQGQSPYQILIAHPELGISLGTLYRYIEDGTLQYIDKDINVLKLRDQAKRKDRYVDKSNDPPELKKRKDHQYLENRLYKDYLAYKRQDPDLSVVQMDTVYNDGTHGPFIQTFKFIDCGVMIGVLHWSKTAEDMISGIDKLEEWLGPDIFRKYVNVLLTDRGSEFTDAQSAERSIYGGGQRTRIFYCDPMMACQKGSLENNHITLRDFCPKKKNLHEIGLTSQEAVNAIMSNINSMPLKHFNGKSPLQMAKDNYEDLFERLDAMGVHLLASDEVTRKPHVLAPFREG